MRKQIRNSKYSSLPALLLVYILLHQEILLWNLPNQKILPVLNSSTSLFTAWLISQESSSPIAGINFAHMDALFSQLHLNLCAGIGCVFLLPKNPEVLQHGFLVDCEINCTSWITRQSTGKPQLVIFQGHAISKPMSTVTGFVVFRL